MFGSNNEEVIRDGRKLRNEEFYKTYYSPNLFRMMILRRIKRTNHVKSVKRKLMHTGFWWECQKERYHLKELDVGMWIKLKLISKKYKGVPWITLI
jgi:hypothetical protein